MSNMILPCGYNAAKARGKRPVPMWADTLLRDTMHLSAEELGSYHLILYAMWKRPECALDNNASRLARIARVSVRKWKAQIGPTITDLMDISNDTVTSSKLLIEAAQTEKWCITQHARNCEVCKLSRDKFQFPLKPETGRKDGENSGNTLKTKNPHHTGVSAGADTPEEAPEKPSQRPKERGGGGGCAREEFFGKIREASNIEASDHEIEVNTSAWAGLGLTEAEMIDVISRETARATAPPETLRYFSKPMTRLVGQKAIPSLQKSDPATASQSGFGAARRAFERLQAKGLA